jgi:hypothetical protein
MMRVNLSIPINRGRQEHPMLQSTRNLLSFSKLHPSSSISTDLLQFILPSSLPIDILFSANFTHIHHPSITIIMGGAWTQLFPPAPHFTEAQTPSLAGKVYIVTGGNSGVGRELVKILYAKGGTVYVAGRTLTKIESAIEEIKAEVAATQTKDSTAAGQLHSLIIDLGNLSTIAPCVSTFLAKESRLDVLFNNAGLSRQAAGSVTTQGHEIHMGTNCLGISFSSLYSLQLGRNSRR